MKPVADTHHLQRRGETWHFYRRVPKSLVPVLGRRFVKRSLGVATLAEAKKLRAVEEVRIDALFEAARKGLAKHGAGTAARPIPMSILTEHVRECVQRLDKRSAHLMATDPPDDREQLDEMRAEAGLTLATLRNPADPERHERIDHMAGGILQQVGAKLDDVQAAEFAEIVRRGLIELNRRKLDRYEDQYDRPFYDLLFDPARPPATSFSALCDLFVAEKEQEHELNKVNPKRTDKIKAAVATLRDIVGDTMPVHEVDDDVVQRVRTTIAATPKSRVLIYPKLSLEKAIEQAAKDGRPTLAPPTQAVYLDVLRDLLKVAVRKKHLSSNPAADVRPIVKDMVGSAQKRLPWSPDQLKGFFEGQFYRSCAPGAAQPYAKSDRAWRFWLPLIMLHTGARPNEICALGTDDVRRTDAGIWFFNVTDNGEGKSLKTQASKRRIPLHPELVKIGFLTFVEERRKGGHGPRLFHELKPGSYGNLAQYAAKRLNETFIPAEITLGNRQSLYSLRHNVRDALRRIKASAETLLAVSGWSPAGKAVSDNYGDPGNPDLHAEAVAGIAYAGLDLSFLHLDGKS